MRKKKQKNKEGRDQTTGYHIPHRTCLACRAVRPKRELVRLVYTSPDTVEIDHSGKREGRGVYLCPSSECWNKGLKRKDRLERAVRGKVNAESCEALRDFGEKLEAEDSETCFGH